MKLYLKNMYYKNTNINNIEDDNFFIGSPNDSIYFQILIDNDNKNTVLNLDKQIFHSLENIVQLRIEVITDFDYELNPLGYVESNNYLKYPEIIYKSSQFNYNGSLIPNVICDLKVPTLTLSNSYEIKVNLYERINLFDERLVDSKVITLKYYNNLLVNNINLYVDFWQHTFNLARSFNIKPFSNEHFEKIGMVFDLLNKLGQKSIMMTVSDMPWRGWGCNLMRDNPANLFEYNIIKITKDLNNNYHYDFTNFDKYIKLAESKLDVCDISLYGIIGIWKMPFFYEREVEYPEKITLSYYDENSHTIKFINKKEDIINYIKAIINHTKELNIFDKVLISADEPSNAESFLKTIELLKKLEPNIKFKIAVDKPDILEKLGNNAHTLAYSFPCTLTNYKLDVNIPNKLYYVCNIPDHPNTQVENTLTETALVPLLNYTFKFNGFLRWAFNCFTLDPINNIKYNINSIPAGDLFFCYPNKDGSLLESTRYRALKRGIILLELLNKLSIKDNKKADILYSSIVNNDKELEVNEDLSASLNSLDYELLYENLLKELSEV